MKKLRLTSLLALLLCLALLLPACSGANAGTETDTQTEAAPGTPAENGTDAPAEPGTVPDTAPGATEAPTEPETEPETLPADLADVELKFEDIILYMKPGETAPVSSNIASDKYAEVHTEVLYANGGDVVTYADGKVTAVGGGCAAVVAENPYTGRTARLYVRVLDPAHDETCIIGAPIWDYRFMNETQMGYLNEAHFNAIFMSHAPDEDIVAFLQSAEQYGIRVYPQLATPTQDELSMRDEVITRRIKMLQEYPMFGGFNLRDEPSYYFDEYARIAQFIYDYDSSLPAMINFLPNVPRETLYNYASRLTDNDYKGILSFDNYIFGPAAGSVSETWLFRNFELFREAGLDNRCRTAFYLQSIGSGTYGYRRPDEGTMFYHAMVSLAYGCTMMRYFSYVTPNLTEYTDGVIDYDGNPTDLFEVTKDLNRQYASFGCWLVHANADEVYHTGAKLDGGADYEIVPDGYWITPADEAEAKKRTILTTFTDRYTGQNYLMVVNKDFGGEVTVTYRLENVPYLWEVDPMTGAPAMTVVNDGLLTVSLTKGNARLFLLPPENTYTTPKTPAVNLFEDAYLTVSSVSDNAGSCTEFLTDGALLSTESRVGWRAQQKEESAWIYADLGAVKTFNRLDLYPAGNGASTGRFFPAAVELQISGSGTDWTTVATAQKPASFETGVSVTFEAVSARYVRLYIPTLSRLGNYCQCELAEICLFNDDGSLPAVSKTDYAPLVVEPGVNVALGKKCCDYSSAQNTPEWHEAEVYLTDGDNSQKDYYAYSSAACRNTGARAHEYFILDLEDVYPIDKIVLYPNYDGTGFPKSYTVEVSENGADWVVVQKVEKGKTNKGEVVTIEFDTLNTAFIKVDATLLTQEANPAAGYVLQIAELEAYTPEK